MPHVRVKENEPFEVAMRRFKALLRKSRRVGRSPSPRVLREADLGT